MVFLCGGWALGEATPPANDAAATTTPSGPHWRFVSTYCEGFKPINDPEHGISWGGEVLPDSIQATYITTDRTDVNHPIELKTVYNWGWQLDPIPDVELGNLYPGEEVRILMTLEYAGIDPQIRGNYAEMHVGAFRNYPKDNNVLIADPGGILEKEVSIEIPRGNRGGPAVDHRHRVHRKRSAQSHLLLRLRMGGVAAYQ
jgi:hypothetical protein